MADRDRTVSRRSEPSSRTTLIGEQPNPWDLLQPQDVMTDIEVPNTLVDMDSWGISLLSPAYLLSVERWPFHSEPPDHHDRLRLCSTCQSRSQAGFCHCTLRTISDCSEPTFARLRYFLGGDRPSQTTQLYNVLLPDYGKQLDVGTREVFHCDSALADAKTSKSPPMLNISFLTPI